MTALENITERINKDSTKKAKKHIDSAKKEANEILKKAKSELEKEKEAIKLETEKSIAIQRSRAISEAKLEARKLKLGAKEEVIALAFETAMERLKNLGPRENELYLRAAIKGAVTQLGSDVEVLCNSKDSQLATKISSEIGPGIGVSSVGIEYLGGAVIRKKDASALIDSTFEGVLKRMKSDLRKEVADILFAGE